MEWEPGSQLIGDFVWVGFDSEVVVTDRVMGELLTTSRGFERGAVEMVDGHPRSGKRSQPRVSLPYGGPALSEMWVTAWVDIDRERSTASLQSSCGHCGTELWNLSGAEHWESHYDLARGGLSREKVPRTEHGGIVINAGELGQADVFRVRQFPAWVLCTSTVREFILDRGYSNVDFLEMGEALDAVA